MNTRKYFFTKTLGQDAVFMEGGCCQDVPLHSGVHRQQGHLMNGDSIQAGEAFSLGQPVLEALKLLNEIEFELYTQPGSEFKGDVLVCISAAVASGLGSNADGSGFFHPQPGRERKAVQPA